MQGEVRAVGRPLQQQGRLASLVTIRRLVHLGGRVQLCSGWPAQRRQGQVAENVLPYLRGGRGGETGHRQPLQPRR